MAKRKVFMAIPELCTGCDLCGLVCSLAKTDTINPSQARIKVIRPSETGLYVPVFCRHCKAPPCRDACPVTDAMHIDEKTGAVVINEAECIGCLACVQACPFGAILIGPGGEVLKCDLCGGDPQCVKHCPPRPEFQFRQVPYPRISCLQYVEPHAVPRRGTRPESRKEASDVWADSQG